MKKAVLYARVSSEAQKKEGTIESQVAELKRQIATSGDVLVREYREDGVTGAIFERPALNQLRKDLKTNLFDVVYFLCADRIARNVVNQNLIIAEIMKYNKQIIVGGRDYAHTPENEFRFLVLGAVAQLERAKIIERSKRGKRHRLKQGFLLSEGYNIYGYDYIRKTNNSPAKLVINEREAKFVRYVFEEFAKGISWKKLARSLEDMGAIRKSGKKLWTIEQMRSMLKNHTYSGIKYYNTRTLVKKPLNPLRAIKYGKVVYRDKSEWIGVKVPAIVSKTLFDKVQKRLEENKRLYRHPKETQLLSNLTRCGVCGSALIAYQRFVRQKRLTNNQYHVYHKAAYRCDRRVKSLVHSKKSEVKRCHNPEVSAKLIEPCIMRMIQETMLNEQKLLNCLEIEKDKSSKQKLMEKDIQKIERQIQLLLKKKKGLIDIYAIGKLTRTEYGKQCNSYDAKIDDLKAKKASLIKSVPSLHKLGVIETSVKHFCETAKTQFDHCHDFDTRRQFLLDHLETIEYKEGRVALRGYLPILLKAYEDPEQTSEASKIGFCVDGKI